MSTEPGQLQKFVFFDLDNTLVNLDEAFQAWTAEFVEEHGLGHEAVEWLLDLDRVGYPHREVFFGKVREHFALSESVGELWSGYRQLMPYLVRCRPEVMNGTADNQLGKIQRTGLAEAVDAYTLSGLEGIRKPDVGLFEIAARRCGTTLGAEGWMVGDHPVADISGGRAAGLRTVWIDRGTWPGEEHQADHVVTDVLQAMEILHDER
ncbi:HAD hydrolase-like protein [Planomonospora venezuelensis]|uniref:HAD hydrolase-like protein n=1 Tax=Planomonospora venezuelensis TaxID=1999 RepID=UPI0016149CFE